jgi:carbon monoxide dehydrogenase subunit G
VELSNEFVVPASIDAAWEVLTDVERIAPCMPGARLDEVDGSEYRGTVKVKVGPVTVEYKGTASFVELDPAAHKAVLRASGRETRGQGNATATVTAQLREEGDRTAVSVLTELDITGRVAQFGRGMLADVSTKLLGQFVERLESDVLGSLGAEGPAAEAPPSPAEVAEVAPAREDDDTLDLGKLLGTSLLRRAVAPIGALLLAVVVVLRRRRRTDVSS